MARLRMLLPVLLLAVACGGGGPQPQLFQPYDSCDTTNGDGCTQGFACIQSSLPSVAFTGDFCTVGCRVTNDCPLLSGQFASICVDGQCFLQCPQGNTCPYGQGCFPFTDANSGDIFSLCTP